MNSQLATFQMLPLPRCTGQGFGCEWKNATSRDQGFGRCHHGNLMRTAAGRLRSSPAWSRPEKPGINMPAKLRFTNRSGPGFFFQGFTPWSWAPPGSRRHALAHQHHLIGVADVADHRRRIVWNHAGHRRQIYAPKEGGDHRLVRRDRTEIAHFSVRSPGTRARTRASSRGKAARCWRKGGGPVVIIVSRKSSSA
jgi:hypothetical protein